MKAQNLTPNIRAAIQEFLEIFAVPEVAPENIFYGNQNNLALPPEGNDYVIYSYISSVRHGTSAEDWTKDQCLSLDYYRGFGTGRLLRLDPKRLGQHECDAESSGFGDCMQVSGRRAVFR